MIKIKVLKFLIFLNLIIFIVNCDKKNDVIKNFEINYGKLNSENLNFVINDFEQSLLKKYPNIEIKLAYKEFVKSIIKNNEVPNLILKKETLNLLNDNCFKANFYNVFYNHINSNSNYYLSILNIENLDSLSLKHVNFIQSGGVNYDFSIAENFFLNKADYNNYFHKRFLFIYLYVSPPDFTIKKDYKYETDPSIILPPDNYDLIK